MMMHRVLCLLLLACLLPALPLAAQSGAGPRPAQVLVLASPEGEAEDPLFADLLFEAVRVELERSNLRAMPSPRPGARLDSGTTGASGRLELIREARADFLLAATFARSGSDARISLAWYNAGTGESTSSASRRGRVDLSLDRTIAEAVQDILAREADRLARWRAETPAASPRERAPKAASGPVPSDPAAGNAALPAAEQGGQEGIAAGPYGPGPSAPAEGLHFRRFELTAGSSAFLAVGHSADYFKWGLFPSLSATWYLRAPGGRFGLGLYTGADLFRAQGTEAAAQFTLMPAGVDLRYSAGGRRLALFARLSGGPALLSWTPTGESAQHTLIGYGMAGIGLYMLFTDGFGLALDTSYMVFATGAELIMGCSPGLNFTVRL